MQSVVVYVCVKLIQFVTQLNSEFQFAAFVCANSTSGIVNAWSASTQPSHEVVIEVSTRLSIVIITELIVQGVYYMCKSIALSLAIRSNKLLHMSRTPTSCI